MDEVRTFASPPASPQGRGEAFGAANASEIGDTYDRYVELFDAVATRPVALPPLGEEALAAIGAYSAPAAEEITAIAHGAGLEPWQIGALNARTEILARLGTRRLHDTSVADRSELTQLMADHSAGAGSVCCHAAPEAALPDRWSTLATISLDVHAGDLSVRAGGPCDHNVGWHTSHAASTASVG
jgi:hypothetical protein